MENHNRQSQAIDEYIAGLPGNIQALLKKLRQSIKESAPEAEETISYGMPAFKLKRILVYFVAFKNHIGFYPTASPIVVFKKELSVYKTSKGAIQFPIDEPIPDALVKKIVKFRVNEVLNKEVSRNYTPKIAGGNDSKPHIEYHKDGSVLAKGNIVNGLPEGYWEWFRKDGSKMRSGYFKNGKQAGEWITYARNGEIVKITNFKG
jgi:uncharacterized protein YdhG (YjbR/CyaY superfamily)